MYPKKATETALDVFQFAFPSLGGKFEKDSFLKPDKTKAFSPFKKP